MKALIPVLLCLPIVATASPSDLLMLMDSLCIGTDNNPATIEKMAKARGGKPLPASVMNADPVAAKVGGKGFRLTINGEKFAVMATNNGACSILGQGLKADDVKQLVAKNYPVLKPAEESSGPQTMTLWKIAEPSVHKGAFISMNAAKDGFGADGAVSLGFLPAKLAQKYSK